jgi:hypothetical protein
MASFPQASPEVVAPKEEKEKLSFKRANMKEAAIEEGPYSLRHVSAEDIGQNAAACFRSNKCNSEKEKCLSELLDMYL